MVTTWQRSHQITKFGPKYKRLKISYLEFFCFFENIISSIQLLYIRPYVPLDIIRIFFNLRFSSRKSQSQPKIFLSVSCQKICTVPYLDAQELCSYSTLKANVYIFLNISVRTFLFQRCSYIVSDCGWVWGEAEQFP